MPGIISGEEVTFGGETFVLPPYNLKFIVELRPGYIEKLGNVTAWGPEEVNLVVEMIHHALVRNYPDLTVDRLMELLDVPAMQELQDVISRVNGFTAGELAPAKASPNGA
jgi:hypothetical protein